ncbi:unnamed protein product [Orchesella dallaii]|uniref:Uncharacterized protein n=1 Tax=Orchesella dallaii TaxID=48710 RepID=A0ABP1QQ51_9HEXA
MELTPPEPLLDLRESVLLLEQNGLPAVDVLHPLASKAISSLAVNSLLAPLSLMEPVKTVPRLLTSFPILGEVEEETPGLMVLLRHGTLLKLSHFSPMETQDPIVTLPTPPQTRMSLLSDLQPLRMPSQPSPQLDQLLLEE